jgi:hypothetical protein
MNAINMPGFTAEASLCDRSVPYQSVATATYISGGQAVIAQLSGIGGIWGGGLGEGETEECEWRCQRCCSRYGCYPCHCYEFCF